jgi:hypothetical protein
MSEAPKIETRRRAGWENEPADSWKLPMWSEEVVIDGQVACRAFWAHGYLYLDVHGDVPKGLLEAGYRMKGYSGSVPVMLPPRGQS